MSRFLVTWLLSLAVIFVLMSSLWGICHVEDPWLKGACITALAWPALGYWIVVRHFRVNLPTDHKALWWIFAWPWFIRIRK